MDRYGCSPFDVRRSFFLSRLPLFLFVLLLLHLMLAWPITGMVWSWRDALLDLDPTTCVPIVWVVRVWACLEAANTVLLCPLFTYLSE